MTAVGGAVHCLLFIDDYFHFTHKDTKAVRGISVASEEGLCGLVLMLKGSTLSKGEQKQSV